MEESGSRSQIKPRRGAPPGMPAPPEALRGAPAASAPVAWGPLAVLERLGENAFGEIFRALDPSLGREVTLKLRRAAASESGGVREARFLDEARRFARVRHPNVLVVHGADRRDGRLGVWTDRIEGRTLEEQLEREGPFSAGEARRVGLELCRALAAIHAAGIIHREVRSENVVRDATGRIVLLDSGSLGDLPPGLEGALEPRHLAPEQLFDEGVSLSTDVYGLGVLLYRLVCGADPVEAASAAERIEKHRRRELVPLRDRRPALPLDFVSVVEKAIDPEPVRRYPNAAAFERALAATLSAAPPAPIPEPGRQRPPLLAISARKLDRWRSAISAVAALALGCTVAIMLLNQPDDARVSILALSPLAPSPLPVPPPARAPAPVRTIPRIMTPAPNPPPLAASSAPEEADESWTYKPIPRTDPNAPHAARPASPPAPAPERPVPAAVAGATAVLRVLAQGPPMPVEHAALADSSAQVEIVTTPDHAQVTIDGERQRQVTRAIFRIAPGEHWVLVEKPGYEPQQLPPLELKPGQRLRAILTLAPAPSDSAGTP